MFWTEFDKFEMARVKMIGELPRDPEVWDEELIRQNQMAWDQMDHAIRMLISARDRVARNLDIARGRKRAA